MPDDNSIDDLLGDFEPDPAHMAKIRRSMRFEIADLPAIDHGNLARPLSIDEGFSITTVAGDTLYLDDIYQYRTYAGVLNGLPFDPASHIEHDIEYVARIFPNHSAVPHVVPPRMHRGRRIAKRASGEEEVEDWCILPRCTSFGRFNTSRLARNAGGDSDGSSVVLVWYQDKFGVPDDERTLQLMAELDWDEFAHNWEY